MFKLEGTLKVANETQVISEKFSKREFVIETNDQYPQLVLFQLTQDKCELLNGYAPGNKLEVSFNLRGRAWTSPAGETKYFNTLEAWKIERVGGAPQQQAQPSSTPANEEDDDLLF